MESIKRSIILLRPGDGPYAYPQSRGMLKLQAASGGLAAVLTVTGLPAGGYMLYLFLQDGAAIFAGDIAAGGLRRTLPGIRLQSVWGAAIIHNTSLSFCLKSTGVDWKDAMMRFKLLHTPRPAWTAPSPELTAPTAEPETQLSEEPMENADEVAVTEAENIVTEQPTHKTVGETEYVSIPHIEEPPSEPEPSMPSPTEPNLSENTDGDDPDPCHSCPHAMRQERINPFPSVFPQSDWVKMSYPGPTGWWHYITGHIYSGPHIVAKAVGVPGEYGMMPPVWLEGFGTFLRCVTPDAHGYWLMFQDAETGEVLDLGLSPHDA